MSNPRSDAVTLCSQIISTTCPKNCAPTIIAGRKKLYIANADFPSDAFSPALKTRRHVLLARPWQRSTSALRTVQKNAHRFPIKATANIRFPISQESRKVRRFRSDYVSRTVTSPPSSHCLETTHAHAQCGMLSHAPCPEAAFMLPKCLCRFTQCARKSVSREGL